MKHKLLLRQIKKYLGGLENIPPQWEGFLNAVDDDYHTNDDDYALLEHTMDVSTVEILESGSPACPMKPHILFCVFPKKENCFTSIRQA